MPQIFSEASIWCIVFCHVFSSTKQMLRDRLELINEEFYTDRVTPDAMDLLLANAWRHFGTHFTRYNFGVHEGEIRRVLPLRVRVKDFKLSKSQRRIIRKNADLETLVRPIELTEETHDLVERHKRRFTFGIPRSVYDFLSNEPANTPGIAYEIRVTREGKLLAASFFDVGITAVSSIYGIFEPDETTQSLGIFTMLKEIEFAAEHGMNHYYPGYAYQGESFYDYKKRFSALETFDWKGNWSDWSGKQS